MSVGKVRQAGFSLLEMMVAIAILGMSLGALYQAAAGATRNVRADERYAYAVELSRSLLAERSVVPLSGVADTGETGDFRWRVVSEAVDMPRGRLPAGSIQAISVRVAWDDGTRERSVVLDSVVIGEDG
jgi:general secretion pathway protein I